MTNTKAFWIACMAGTLAFYGWAALHLAQGDGGHRSVLVAAIVLGLHLLEIPWAFRMLRRRDPSAPRVILGTLLFGLLWWVPAKRGLIAVR